MGHRAISYNSWSQPALPEVPKPDARPLADRPARRTARYALRSCREVYAAHQLAPLALQNKEKSDLRAAFPLQKRPVTLIEIAADPKHLGAEIGFFQRPPHTWNQKLQHHPCTFTVSWPPGEACLQRSRTGCAPEMTASFYR